MVSEDSISKEIISPSKEALIWALVKYLLFEHVLCVISCNQVLYNNGTLR
jgi:hypothetical protein